MLILNLCPMFLGFLMEDLNNLQKNLTCFLFDERKIMVSGLIKDHAYLLMHKFMAHNIFGKQDSTRVLKDELFMLWCMHTNNRVSSAYFIVQTIQRVVQAKRAALSMGHIIASLGQSFSTFNVTYSTKGIKVLKSRTLSPRTLIHA